MTTSKKKRLSIYLIGYETDRISGRKLPTSRQVLRLFFFKHNTLNLTLRDSARRAILEVECLWNQAGIPVCEVRRGVNKLLKLHQQWKNLQKNQHRKKNPNQQAKEKRYVDELEKLFDIAHQNAAEMVTKEQLEFLTSQRSQRRGFISVFSRSNSAEVGTRQVAEESLDGINPESTEHSTETGSDHFTPSGLTQSSTSSEMKRTVSNFSDDLPEPKRTKINIMTPLVAAALDRTRTSSRSASYILSAVAISLGLDVGVINLSSSAIHKRRIQLREDIANQLKEDIRVADNLVVHWDGKLLPEIGGSESVERLPVIVSGIGTEQLLGVPKLASGTGENVATAVVDTLYEWSLSERVKAMCFDTTSVNTGRINGACVLIEDKLEKKLLHLACRHHIFELVLRSVFETCWPTTIGPNVPVFKRFQQCWTKIDKTQYETGLIDESVVEILRKQKDDVLHFIRNQFEVSQPRDDYKEFLELSCIFLGGEPPRGIKFRVPGAMHHARWLSKALYCLKMYLFRKQFTLRARESKSLVHICVFIVTIYVKAWFNAPLAVKAPCHDLKLLQNLINYRNINADISAAASAKFGLHLWYLSEVLAALAFFDDTVSVEVKSKMALAVKQREGSTTRPNRIVLNKRELETFSGKDISDFVTKHSLWLFEHFQLPYNFLEKSPELWTDDPDFATCQSTFKNLAVVNDMAERGVALIEEYNNCLTKSEEQKQYLLQIVKDHRKQYPNTNKKSL